MIYELILTVLLALSLAYVLRLVWREIKPQPKNGVTWDESIFDDLGKEIGGLDNEDAWR